MYVIPILTQLFHTIQFQCFINCTLMLSPYRKSHFRQCSPNQSSANPYFALWRIIGKPHVWCKGLCVAHNRDANRLRNRDIFNTSSAECLSRLCGICLEFYDWTSSSTPDTLHRNISKYNRLTPLYWTASTYTWLFIHPRFGIDVMMPETSYNWTT